MDELSANYEFVAKCHFIEKSSAFILHSASHYIPGSQFDLLLRITKLKFFCHPPRRPSLIRLLLNRNCCCRVLFSCCLLMNGTTATDLKHSEIVRGRTHTAETEGQQGAQHGVRESALLWALFGHTHGHGDRAHLKSEKKN